MDIGLSDEQLLAAFARGDREALGTLAARHEPALLGLAMGLLGGSRAGACDAVQEAWVKVIRHAGKFRGQSSVKTWLYRITINECRNLRGAAARDGALKDAGVHLAREAGPKSDDGPSNVSRGDEPWEAHEARGVLREAVEQLTESRRLVVLLCYQSGMTHEQAADVLGLPLGTLKSRLHAALTSLRAALAKEAGA